MFDARARSCFAGTRRALCVAAALMWLQPAEASAQAPKVAPPRPLRALPWRQRPPAPELATVPAFRLNARVMTGLSWKRERSVLSDGSPWDKELEPELQQVRLGLKGQLATALRLNVSFDLADALSPPLSSFDLEQPPYLRTAALEYRFSKRLRLRAGRFKRPFSQLELRGALDLPVSGRGLLNSYVIEENQWGDRALGAMASGKLKRTGIRWALAVSQAEWRASNTREGYDAFARVGYQPWRPLTFSLGAGRKQIRFAPGDVRSGFAYEADLRFKRAGWDVLAEGLFAQLPLQPEGESVLGGVGLVSYSALVSEQWRLRPFLFGEYAAVGFRGPASRAIRVAAGFNLMTARSHFRIMPQLEWVQPLGTVGADSPWSKSSSRALLLLVLAL